MRADDLRAVLDAVGSERAVVMGDADGGALAVFFAATHPERVQALILNGAYARAAWAPDYPSGKKEEEYLAEREDMENDGARSSTRKSGWIAKPLRSPTTSSTSSGSRSGMRHGASPAAALEFMDMWYAIDVRSVLGSVQAPTLVLAIPGASSEHPTWGSWRVDPTSPSGSPARDTSNCRVATSSSSTRIRCPVLDEIERFIRSVSAEEAEIDRVLATVLFTDIVGSTDKAVELGDNAWRDLLARHHEVVRAMIGRYRGKEIDTAGDGFLATFDGPARGVRCAQAIVEAMQPLGIEIRAGLHTGEIALAVRRSRGSPSTSGPASVRSHRPSEVLVSQTVEDLVAGSGLTFEDAGEHELKGVPIAGTCIAR